MTKAQLVHDLNILKNELEKAEIKLSVSELRGISQDSIKSEIKTLKCKITKLENLQEKM